VRRVARIIGWLTVAHLVWYGFSGVPLWAPVGADEGRAMILSLAHVGAIVSLGASYMPEASL
jgi:hypothetical protein